MSIGELWLIGIGLSMDAFAVAMCKGLGMKTPQWGQGAGIALLFGAFQGLMPLAGWLLGKRFEGYITPVDHWIAFGLLTYIGSKMIWDALHEQPESEGQNESALNLKELLILAVATSIDALAVGIPFAFLQVKILPAATLIALTTFGLSLGGVAIGHQFGARFQTGAQIAGGGVLMLMGVKILLEHLGLLPG